jgi:RNA polymerase sigma factor (sigma-70 family)
MSEETSFLELMGRVRAGDADAARELLRRYEPVLRRVVRVRLADARLRRLFDGSDVCQSVLGSFFVRAALGQYELEEPDDLLKLLATMARNKLIDRARRPDVTRRADRHIPVAELPEHALCSPEASPSQQVALRELVREARGRLPAGERQLLELREQGLEWGDIAAQIGGKPEALRKRLARAVDLVAQELGVDEAN